MYLKQLSYLIEISKHRSMNKASEVLFLSQQALSLSMKSLEEELGFKLFNRSPQGITLTPKGKQLVDISEKFIKELDELQKDYQTFSLYGIIDLYTPEPLLENFLAKPISEIVRICPNLNIQIHEYPYEKTLNILQKQQLPYCFWYQLYIDGHNIIDDIPNMYDFVPIMKAKYFCIVNKVHPYKNRKSVSLHDMASEKFIMHVPSKYFLGEIWKYHGTVPRYINVQNSNMINEMLHVNAGIAFTSLSLNNLKTYSPFDNSYIVIPIEETIIGEIGYLVPKKQPLNSKTADFLQLIDRKLNEL